MSETDTRYFDSEFTGESVELTPPDADGPTDISTITEVDETTFPGFSYQVGLPEGPHQVGSLSLNPALHLTLTEDYLQLRMFNLMSHDPDFLLVQGSECLTCHVAPSICYVE